MAETYGYVKYNANGIVALLCVECTTNEELDTIGLEPNGLEPITSKGSIVCKRCKKVCE
jgi:hypothetical protein